METDKLLVGRLLGVNQAGLYYMTQRVGVLPTRELVSPLQRILFPAYSRLTDDLKHLRQVALESVNAIGTLSIPAGFGFALVAADFVPVALGDQWLAIVPLLVVLVPYLGLRATLSMTMPCLLALGRTKLLFYVSLGYALVHLPLFVAGTHFHGLPGAIWSIVLAGIIYTGLNAWMLWTTLAIRLPELVLALRRPFLAALVMIGAVRLLQSQLASAEDSQIFLLLATVLLGAASYLIALCLFWHFEGRPAGFERRFLLLLDQRWSTSL